jgi:hypothetical protein
MVMGGLGSGRQDRRRWRSESMGRLDLADVGDQLKGRKGAPNASFEMTCTRSDGTSFSARVGFVTTPLHFGGHRLWFCCPRCRKRCSVLFGGRDVIGCRRCLRLSYASQSEAPRDRAHRAIAKIERRLISRRGHFYKPKGMSWRTFHRMCDRYDRHDQALNVGCIKSLQRISARFHAR